MDLCLYYFVVSLFIGDCYDLMQDIGLVDCKYGELMSRESILELDDCCESDSLTAESSSRREYQEYLNLIFSDPLFSGLSKFMMCFGLLTLQGSQPAIASTDFSSGLQSIPFLGDLGDISTGFASVTKISL